MNCGVILELENCCWATDGVSGYEITPNTGTSVTKFFTLVIKSWKLVTKLGTGMLHHNLTQRYIELKRFPKTNPWQTSSLRSFPSEESIGVESDWNDLCNDSNTHDSTYSERDILAFACILDVKYAEQNEFIHCLQFNVLVGLPEDKIAMSLIPDMQSQDWT